jgi:hypothetical protein
MLYQLSYASGGNIYLSIWSGRRESNPQPTAWKAVTLPLSYSRPRRETERVERTDQPVASSNPLYGNADERVNRLSEA